MPIATCPSVNELEQLFQGQPSDASAERLERHVQECAACLGTLKELLHAKDTVSGAFAGTNTLGDDSAQPLLRQLMSKLEALRPASDSNATAGFATPSSGSPISGTDDAESAEVGEELTVSQIDHYRLVKKLGAGGMGMVYEAIDTHLERPVALKVMMPSLAKNPASRKRFLLEARAAAAITHDHIVPIHQVGEDHGIPYLAMQLLQGVSLADLLKKRPIMKPSHVIRLGMQMAEGLAAAHARGLIHRDIKPGNIWIEPVQGGRVKILDFGLARLEKGNANITQSGVIVGTPAYMAPEQARGEKNLDPRVDLFSLGCVLYFMATGQMAFGGNDPVGVLMAVQMQEPPPPRQLNADVPPAFSDLIMRLLEKEPSKRPASAQEVVKALKSVRAATAPETSGAMPAAIADAARAPSVTAATPADSSNPFANLPTVAPRGKAIAAPAVARRRASAQRKQWLLVAAAVGLLGMFAAGIVFFLQTREGWVRIEIDDPEIKVVINQQDGAEIIGIDKQKITVTTGKHGLTITRGDFKFDTTTFHYKKGDRTTLKIDWLEGKRIVVLRDNEKIGEQAAPPVQVAAVGLPRGDYGLEFDGKTAYVDIPSLEPDTTGPVTIEAQVKIEAPLDSAETIASAYSAGSALFLGRSGGKTITFLARRASQAQFAGHDSEQTESRWRHFAGVWDGKQARLFIDGKLAFKSGSNIVPAEKAAVQKQHLMLGAEILMPDLPLHGWFHGVMRQVRVSKSARYDKDYTPSAQLEADKDTLAVYRFQEGQGDVLKDSSGNSHHGKIFGAKWVKANGTSSELPPIVVKAPSPAGHAVRMSGAGVQLDTSSISLKGRPTWTVEAWVTPRQPIPQGGEAALVLMVDPVWIAQRSGARWAMGGPTSRPGSTIFTGNKLEVGKPTHLAMSRSPQGVSFFVNGVREGAEPLPIVFAVGQQWLRVSPMGNPKARDVGFHGDIDELRVSSVERYQGNFVPRPRFDADGDTLALYHFDEGEGEEFKDSSGNNRHGKIVGAKWVMADGTPMIASQGFADLLNGKDLGGWKVVPATAADAFRFQDGVLKISGQVPAYLYTEKSYQNFALEYEWRFLNKPGNGGVFVHVQGPHQVWPKAYEIQGLFQDMGKVFSTADQVEQFQLERDSLSKALKGPTDWHRMEIRSAHGQLTVHVNGALVSHGKTVNAVAGPIAFQSEEGEMEVRNIRIRDLNASGTGAKLVKPDGAAIAPAAGAKFANSLGMQFALVPKGKSWLGGGGGNPGTREVDIPQDFYLGVHTVTQEEWENLMGSNPSVFSRSGMEREAVKDVSAEQLKRFPVESVSWDDAQLFLAKLNEGDKRPGWEYRLPTEVQWEYACRGGPMADRSESAFDFYSAKPTNELTSDLANFANEKTLKRTTKVGSYPPNRLGLYDMHGNVWQWCADIVVNDSQGRTRAFRGGCWHNEADICRAIYGARAGPSARLNGVGLRVGLFPIVKDPVAPGSVPAATLRTPPEVKNLVKVRDLDGHKDEVNSVGFSADGRLTITGSRDKTAAVWDVESGKRIAQLIGHTEVVTCVALSSDGRLALTGSEDKTVAVWEAKSGRNIQFIKAHTGTVRSVAFAPDDRRAVSGGEDHAVYLLSDLEAAAAKSRKLVGHTDKVTSVAFVSKGDKVLSGGWDATARLWNATTGSPIRQFTGHQDWVQAVAISPDGKLVLTGSGGGMVGNSYIGKSDCSVRLWDVETGQELKKFTGDWGGISCVGFLPDGGHIFFAEWAARKPNPSLHVWDTTNGWAVARWSDPAGPSVVAAAVSSDGKHALVGRAFNAGSKAPLLRLSELGLGKTGAVPLALPPSVKQFTNTLGMEFALVPKGKTRMGGMAGKAPNDDYVDFKEDLYLGVYEVTQEEWVKIMGGNPSGHSRTGKKRDAVKDISVDDLKRFPMENVSFNDAQEFIARLNEKLKEPGWEYRLPTQGEWQYACRGGPAATDGELGFDFYFDRPTNVLLSDRANFNRQVGRPKKVGSYLPNRLGLYDMHGNVGEWCHDKMTDIDGSIRIGAHGGSWTHVADWCRAVFIVRSQPFARFDDMGFRLARVPKADLTGKQK